jgi:hypothetical protein
MRRAQGMMEGCKRIIYWIVLCTNTNGRLCWFQWDIVGGKVEVAREAAGWFGSLRGFSSLLISPIL